MDLTILLIIILSITFVVFLIIASFTFWYTSRIIKLLKFQPGLAQLDTSKKHALPKITVYTLHISGSKSTPSKMAIYNSAADATIFESDVKNKQVSFIMISKNVYKVELLNKDDRTTTYAIEPLCGKTGLSLSCASSFFANQNLQLTVAHVLGYNV